MADFALTTLAQWLSTLFVTDMFGSAVLAGIFGIIMITILAVQFKLSGDALLVLMIFVGTLFSYFALPVGYFSILLVIMFAFIVGFALYGLMKK